MAEAQLIKGKRRTTWGFPEELRPGMRTDFKLISNRSLYNSQAPKGTVVERVKTHPWYLTIWEPLTTKVPGPHMSRVWVCYANTVIFYLNPMVPREYHHIYNIGGKWGKTKPGQHIEEWNRSQYSFMWDDIVEFEGERFKVG